MVLFRIVFRVLLRGLFKVLSRLMFCGRFCRVVFGFARFGVRFHWNFILGAKTQDRTFHLLRSNYPNQKFTFF